VEKSVLNALQAELVSETTGEEIVYGVSVEDNATTPIQGAGPLQWI
jgi:hypothetical protein